MWQNSTLLDMFLKLLRPEDSGWICNGDGKFSVDWEAPEVQEKTQGTTKETHCGPGCEC